MDCARLVALDVLWGDHDFDTATVCGPFGVYDAHSAENVPRLADTFPDLQVRMQAAGGCDERTPPYRERDY